MITQASILVIDDDRDILHTASILLKQYYSDIEVESDPTQIPSLITRKDYDLILLDMNFRRGNNDGKAGFYWLEQIIELRPEQVVILITAYGEVDLAVRAIKAGAMDFILKPWQNQKLLATVHSAIQLTRAREDSNRVKQTMGLSHSDQLSEPGGLLGESLEIKKVREMISKVAPTDAHVLITGENGTGKDLAALSLHLQSDRKSEPFVRVDLGAISSTLFESELFGHKKGAFTDAREDKVGRFQLANQGTIFLDEMGNAPLEMQSKLLSVLQNKEVVPVGGTQVYPVDIRVISATNIPIEDAIQKGLFREDLYYRLNTVEIHLPPLRQRKGDIEWLSTYFVNQFSQKYKKPSLQLAAEAIQALTQYTWPGNVREMKHILERSVILNDTGIIRETDLLLKNERRAWEFSEVKPLEEVERDYLLFALQSHDGNVTRTAQSLGLTRMAMYRRMKKYGIK